MAITYSSANKVGNLLGFPDSYFTLSSTPTVTVVEGLIDRVEDKIDSTTGHAWRAITVTDEQVRPNSIYRYGTGIRFDLTHRSIRSISTLKVWDGSAWVDWVATKTEGRDKDYWIDLINGVVFLLGVYRIYPHGVKVTYVYGETSVSGGVEDCATMMVAMKILNSPEFSAVLFTQAGEHRPDHSSIKNDWKEEIKGILNNNQEFQ